MKTFKDLVFNSSNRARIKDFGNNYGVSVITGYGTYSNESNPYELAVLFNNELCYTTEITDDVIGWLTEDEVTEIMIKIQNL